jgi:uncharacterized membrane protein
MKRLNAPRPWILLASLSVNLFLVGLIVAAVASGPHGAGWHKGRPPPPARHMIRALGEEARPAVEKVMSAQEGAFRAAGEAHRTANKVYRDALTAEPFNSQNLTDALAARRQTKAQMRQLMDKAFVEIVADVGPDARKKLAEMRHRGRPRRDREHRRD